MAWGSTIPSRFMLQKPELSDGLMGLLARMQTLPFTFEQKNEQNPGDIVHDLVFSCVASLQAVDTTLLCSGGRLDLHCYSW